MKTSLNSLKIFAFLFLSLSLLACNKQEVTSQENEGTKDLHPAARIEALQKMKKSIHFNFISQEKGDKIVVELWLENPEKREIQSAEAWLTFNPEHVEIHEVTYGEGFDLPAPYPKVIDTDLGILKLGAAGSKSKNQDRIQFAEFSLTKKEGATFFDLFDSANHASVNTIIDGSPYNLFVDPNLPALILP